MNIIKKKAFSILERQMIKHGFVLDVRAWSPATFYEVDVHLPDVHMEKWHSVQHIKVKVADCTYRDYTPAMWDAETQTCTLYINASHDGAGSKWASALKKGAIISYVGIAPTQHKPIPGRRLLCLGDNSSLGHFLALQQLTVNKSEICGALSFASGSHVHEFARYFDINLEPLQEKSWDFILVSWLEQQQLNNETIYIAGHIPTAVQLRKHLKLREDFRGSVKVQGFWS